jgi:aryl-alcohol dehydrogenase-like predicted oxidoreductase
MVAWLHGEGLVRRSRDCLTLRRPEVTGAVVGARRPEQVDGFIGAMDCRRTEEEMEEIERALPEPVPLM